MPLVSVSHSSSSLHSSFNMHHNSNTSISAPRPFNSMNDSANHFLMQGTMSAQLNSNSNARYDENVPAVVSPQPIFAPISPSISPPAVTPGLIDTLASTHLHESWQDHHPTLSDTLPVTHSFTTSFVNQVNHQTSMQVNQSQIQQNVLHPSSYIKASGVSALYSPPRLTNESSNMHTHAMSNGHMNEVNDSLRGLGLHDEDRFQVSTQSMSQSIRKPLLFNRPREFENLNLNLSAVNSQMPFRQSNQPIAVFHPQQQQPQSAHGFEEESKEESPFNQPNAFIHSNTSTNSPSPISSNFNVHSQSASFSASSTQSMSATSSASSSPLLQPHSLLSGFTHSGTNKRSHSLDLENLSALSPASAAASATWPNIKQPPPYNMQLQPQQQQPIRSQLQISTQQQTAMTLNQSQQSAQTLQQRVLQQSRNSYSHPIGNELLAQYRTGPIMPMQDLLPIRSAQHGLDAVNVPQPLSASSPASSSPINTPSSASQLSWLNRMSLSPNSAGVPNPQLQNQQQLSPSLSASPQSTSPSALMQSFAKVRSGSASSESLGGVSQTSSTHPAHRSPSEEALANALRAGHKLSGRWCDYRSTDSCPDSNECEYAHTKEEAWCSFCCTGSHCKDDHLNCLICSSASHKRSECPNKKLWTDGKAVPCPHKHACPQIKRGMNCKYSHSFSEALCAYCFSRGHTLPLCASIRCENCGERSHHFGNFFVCPLHPDHGKYAEQPAIALKGIKHGGLHYDEARFDLFDERLSPAYLGELKKQFLRKQRKQHANAGSNSSVANAAIGQAVLKEKRSSLAKLSSSSTGSNGGNSGAMPLSDMSAINSEDSPAMQFHTLIGLVEEKKSTAVDTNDGSDNESVSSLSSDPHDHTLAASSSSLSTSSSSNLLNTPPALLPTSASLHSLTHQPLGFSPPTISMNDSRGLLVLSSEFDRELLQNLSEVTLAANGIRLSGKWCASRENCKQRSCRHAHTPEEAFCGACLTRGHCKTDHPDCLMCNSMDHKEAECQVKRNSKTTMCIAGPKCPYFNSGTQQCYHIHSWKEARCLKCYATGHNIFLCRDLECRRCGPSSGSDHNEFNYRVCPLHPAFDGNRKKPAKVGIYKANMCWDPTEYDVYDPIFRAVEAKFHREHKRSKIERERNAATK